LKVRFLLVGEGATDLRLAPILQSVCVVCGAAEASGIAPDLGRLPTRVGKTVRAQVEAALSLEPDANVVFVHRDADDRSSDKRRAEIDKGVSGIPVPVVPIVPIQETEAWLLLDESAIRYVAGNPKGRSPLGLPRPSQVESTASPKEVLQAALVAASELTGRKLERFKSNFSQHRALLFDRLDINGRIQELSAWQALLADVRAALR
jgi:hypothetical protein